MSNGAFEKAGGLIKEDAAIWLPNTREVFRGRDKYVEFNKKYPGRWIITVEKLFCKDNCVVTAVKVESEDKTDSFYATSFFTLKDSLICEITEYWGENGPPPEWRTGSSLSDRY
jgi:hypothetical protein